MNVLSVVEYQGFWGSFGDLIWWFLSIFVLFAYIMAVFSVISDLFRDHTLNGWWKAVWVVFLIFVPFLTVLIYLIARGRGMSERSAARYLSRWVRPVGVRPRVGARQLVAD